MSVNPNPPMGQMPAQYWDQYFEGQRDAIQAQKDQADRTYQLEKSRARTAAQSAAADARYRQAQIGIARQELALKAEIERGRLQLDTVLGLGTLGVNRGNQALSAIDLMGKYSERPSDYVKYANAVRGVRGVRDLPAAFEALAENTRLPAFSAVGDLPGARSIESILGDTYGSTGQTDKERQAQALTAYGKQALERGPQALLPSSLQSLTDIEKGLYESAINSAGGDYGDFWQRYLRSGIGQGSSRAA